MKIAPILLLFAVLAVACSDPCPYNSEPQAYITFYQKTSSGASQVVAKQYDSVYGIGSRRQLASSDDKDASYVLPLPLNQDSASFVFVAYDGSHDTLALTYTRNFDYTNTRCGLAASISNLRLRTSQTTFSGVQLRDNNTTERSTLTTQRIGVWIDITLP